MSSADLDRDELKRALAQLGREHSTAAVMFHSALAERFGLSATDWKCAEIVHRMGPMTAGQLAELSGLTTGAITGVIDRLEKQEIVRRGKDPNDRRRVIIHPLGKREEEAMELFAPFQESLAKLYARFDDEELALIFEYLKQETELLQQEASRMRQQMS
ncbi:MAG: MarR family transcriptional regulator [Chloroflexota bacterium]